MFKTPPFFFGLFGFNFPKKTANHSNIKKFLLFSFKIPPFFSNNFQGVVSRASKQIFLTIFSM